MQIQEDQCLSPNLGKNFTNKTKYQPKPMNDILIICLGRLQGIIRIEIGQED